VPERNNGAVKIKLAFCKNQESETAGQAIPEWSDHVYVHQYMPPPTSKKSQTLQSVTTHRQVVSESLA
jgi:hypothetical protein